MRNLHVIASIVAVFSIAAIPMTAGNRYDIEVDGIYYILGGDTASVTYATSGSYNDYSGDVVIPNQIVKGSKTYRVAAIDDYAFHYCYDLNSITLGDSLTTICMMGIYKCGIKEINIPDNVTSLLAYSLAENDSLKTAKIGAGVTYLKPDLFYKCYALEEVTLGENVNHLGTYVFARCTSLKTVHWSGKEDGINSYTFLGCTSLEEIELPESITFVKKYAFSGCTALTKIYSYATTPPSITEENAFDDDTYENATLYVPTGCKETYAAATYWSRFINIEEMEDLDGVDEICNESKTIVSERLYNLSGVETTEDSDGSKALYIVKRVYSDGTVSTAKEIR